jgi:DNA topoisomerase I
MPRVEAQQARRIVDRIVGYQVSPILWKKVAGGLSAGRVQSVATRIVVEREQEIRAFTPAESWEITANMTFDVERPGGVARGLDGLHGPPRREVVAPPFVRDRMAWLAEHRGLECDLVEVGGKSLRIEAETRSTEDLDPGPRCRRGSRPPRDQGLPVKPIPNGKGRGKNIVRLDGRPDPQARYTVESIDVTRTRSRPYPPFITSTLQQAASSRLGMSTDRTMRIAQQLYEGIDLPDEGRVGLITYMRTDSTNLSREAIEMARRYLEQRHGAAYVPEKPRTYASSNESAQEAHEAIRPTDAFRDPDRSPQPSLDIRRAAQALPPDLAELRGLPGHRRRVGFDGVRMRRSDRDTGAVFKANGRVLRFDGFYRVSGTTQGRRRAGAPRFREGAEARPVRDRAAAEVPGLRRRGTPRRRS